MVPVGDNGAMLHGVALVIAFVVGITFHEFAHGWAADKIGDPTARYAGRLTLNPLAHVDPVGTILVPALLLFSGSRFVFGWAKPVPINPYNFRDRRRGLILVSLAGPLANIAVAVLATLLLRFWGVGVPNLDYILVEVILINIFLAIFNLIPVPPLDGSKVLAGLIPGRQEWLVWLEQYGMLVLLLLIFTGAISWIGKNLVLPLAQLLIYFGTGASVI
ncbi:MAG: site-2 protease family protein [Bacillota bacterium]